MTFGQLMTLTDEHQAAQQTGGQRPDTGQPAFGLLEMAAMQ